MNDIEQTEIETEAREVKEEAPKKEEPKKSAASPSAIAVEEGALVPHNSTELVRTLDQIAEGGGFPAIFDTRQKRIAAYSLANALMGSRWQLALNNIAIIKGKMAIWGELPGALAEQTKEVAEKEVFCVDENLNRICIVNKNLNAAPYAGVCLIQRKGRSMKEFQYTIDEAKAAGQYPPMKWDKNTRQEVLNEDSPWHKWPKIMLMRKAMAMAIKFEFADAMIGTPIAEYDFDEIPDMKDVGPSVSTPDRAKDLNSRFSAPAPSQDDNAVSPS